jgi:purine-binding chemotaxis protein CheW
MSSDVLAPAPAVAFSPHTLAAALNTAAANPAAATAAVVALAAESPSEPGEEQGADELLTGMLMFRVGAELFAASLADVEEAIELPELTPLPEMPPHMLGVLRVRGATVPLYSPAGPLGLRAGAPQAALVVRAGGDRVALAIDDVEDVIELRDGELRPTPDASDDRVLVGVVRRGHELVSAVDVGALVAACVGAAREVA